MYSFQYDESETWAVWPNDIDMSEFNEANSGTVITQIFRQLFNDVREPLNDLKTELQKQKSLLTVKMNELLTLLEDYWRKVQINEDFVRYFIYPVGQKTRVQSAFYRISTKLRKLFTCTRFFVHIKATV